MGTPSPRSARRRIPRATPEQPQRKENLVEVKILKPHSANCALAREPDCWVFDDAVWLSANGSKRGHTVRWLTFWCNDPQCGANGIVRGDSLSVAINDSLK
jgi:hypothetical protein